MSFKIIYEPNTLVPKFYRDNYDDVASDFLERYWDDWKKSQVIPMPVPIADIAQKYLELTVVDKFQLSADGSVLGIIAFAEGEISVYNPNKDELSDFPVTTGMVLIDREIKKEGRERNSIAHECVHWTYHRQYFTRLRSKFAKPGIAFRCPNRHVKDVFEPSNEEERMERQARGIAPRILMPKKTTTLKVHQLLKAYNYSKDMPGHLSVIKAIVDALADFFGVSKLSAKIRLVDLGFLSFADSQEFYSYNNQTAYTDFGDEPLIIKSLDRPLTRNITLIEAFDEYAKNQRFREILRDGNFRFVEDSFVINDSKYAILSSNGEFHLTEYARQNPEECTLLFGYTTKISITNNNQNDIAQMMHLLTLDDCKRIPFYAPNVQNDTVSGTASKIAREKAQKAAMDVALGKIKAEFDEYFEDRVTGTTAMTFWERIEQIMERKGIDLYNFKLQSGLDENTVKNIRLQKLKTITMRTGMAVCVGLDLSFPEAQRLLGTVRLAFADDRECIAYEMILTSFKGCSLEERNIVLKELGVQPLGVQQKR